MQNIKKRKSISRTKRRTPIKRKSRAKRTKSRSKKTKSRAKRTKSRSKKTKSISSPKHNLPTNGMIQILKNVYTQKECEHLVEYSEDCGYSNTLTNKFNEYFYEPEFRNDQGVAINDQKIAQTLLNRVSEYIKESNLKINPLLRFSKYAKGGGVVDHQDSNITIDGFTSKYTVLLYLNDAQGGETEFDGIKVGCKRGQIVIFDQSLYHKANLAETTKYILRTDILVNVKDSDSSLQTGKLSVYDSQLQNSQSRTSKRLQAITQRRD